MPCWTVSNSTVDLGKMQLDLLHAALAAMGLNPVTLPTGIRFAGGFYDKATGKMTGTSLPAVNEVNQSYAAQVVKTTAQKYGWALKQTAQYKYEVIRR
jgi:hypothetical protein